MGDHLAGCFVVARDGPPLKVNARGHHKPVVNELSAAGKLDLFCARIDIRGAVVDDRDAVLILQGIVTVGDEVHVVQSTEYGITKRAGDEFRIPLNQCDVDPGGNPAQIFGTAGAPKTSAYDDNTATGLTGLGQDRPTQH